LKHLARVKNFIVIVIAIFSWEDKTLEVLGHCFNLTRDVINGIGGLLRNEHGKKQRKILIRVSSFMKNLVRFRNDVLPALQNV
jgi:hypothetical protein